MGLQRQLRPDFEEQNEALKDKKISEFHTDNYFGEQFFQSIVKYQEDLNKAKALKIRRDELSQNLTPENQAVIDKLDEEIAKIEARLSNYVQQYNQYRYIDGEQANGDNTQNLIPLKLKPNSKFLIINFQEFSKNDDTAPCIKTLGKVCEELQNRGHSVDMYLSRDISHYELEKIKDNYDCILLNCRISSKDYLGGTLRINWDNIMPFWRGVAIDHPCVVFTSFGDPYKLYELPFLRTYVNAYSSSHHTQRAFVKVLLGEIEPQGKSPVELKGFFEREV